MKIYSWENYNGNLRSEKVYLSEDWPANSYYDSKRENGDRNLEEYDCTVHWGTYKRIKFERLYNLYYYEVDSVEQFLRENPEIEVLFTRSNFFVKTWMD